VTLPREASVLVQSLFSTAQELGYIGSAPVDVQIERSLAFTVIAHPARLALDLGSGGGLPGLVLALAWRNTHWYLVDSSHKRTEWLKSAVISLGLTDNCHVVCERAEHLGRTQLRATFDLVTARSFGPPGPTAECAAPLLKVGGELVVAEPPEPTTARWPSRGLDELGMVWVATEAVDTPAGPVNLSRLVALSECPDRYPRRVGVPSKRPLF
jgi:16S rRNA (guanine527-N7)-methyltransferase